MNTTVQENLTNVRVVKSFVREDYENEQFRKANRDLKESGLRAINVMIFTMPLMTFFMNFTSLAVVWFGGKQVMAGDMMIGDLTAFITYITQILSSLMMVSMIFMNASRAIASGKRIGEVLDENVDLNDLNAKNPEKKVTEGRIEFKNVNFRYYKNNKEKVLDNVNLTIEPGKVVGIIGSTGCGKTTLVSMIPRLYDVDEGQVLVDGVDVRDYNLKNLRNGVGMVLQKNLLFSGTIEENLRWGDAQADMDAIEDAARHACRLKNALEQECRRRLSLGAGDADELEPLLRMAVERAGDAGHGRTHIRDNHLRAVDIKLALHDQRNTAFSSACGAKSCASTRPPRMQKNRPSLHIWRELAVSMPICVSLPDVISRSSGIFIVSCSRFIVIPPITERFCFLTAPAV